MAFRGRTTRAVLAIGAAGVLAAGVAACGDDEGSGSSGGGSASKDEEVTIGLITKTESNPFFVKMKEGAQAAAKENNVKLLTASGKSDTDNAEPGDGDREHDDAGREGDPRRPGRLEGDRPGDPEGA